ncbi:linker histone H1 and H5 family protein [Dictyocaulus viviparus]|uniref:Linker histone H1 and H5 family protein n=1 Tax=Dictyocaulus viviparus TaxID=29172 RepID=A0A0D8Y386_DICVI|nr:linker histone H1 and H5 family protein [Dictyocaulus viviparus]
MTKSIKESINIDCMKEINAESAPFKKLDEKSKDMLNKRNPVPHAYHPTYLTMIKDAVKALNENKGVSKPALLKYLAQHYQLGENLPKINSHLCTALRKALKDGTIEQTKGHGASGSFKLGNMKSSSKTRPRKHTKTSKTSIASTRINNDFKNKLLKSTKKTEKLVKPISAAKEKKTKIMKGAKKSVRPTKSRVQKKRGAIKNKAPRAKKA